MLKTKRSLSKRTWLHDSFEIMLFIKGLDGLFEVLGGLLIIFFSPARLSRVLVFLTQHELAEDPNDLFVNFLMKTSHAFSVSAQHFAVFYLLSHGIVKLILVQLLWMKKLWAYPLMIVFLLLFIVYQIYRYSYSHSSWLIILTVFDLIMIWLTWIEYRRIRQEMRL